MSSSIKAEVKTLKQWIDIFTQQGYHLFYSSDYLGVTTLNQPLNIESPTIMHFNSAMSYLDLYLQPVDSKEQTVFVIKSKNEPPISSFIIHAHNQETGSYLKHFSITDKKKQTHNSENKNIFLIKESDLRESITVTADGYFPTEIELSMMPGQTQIINVTLTKLPLQLSDIRVSTSLTSFNNQYNSQKSLSREDLKDNATLNNDPLRAAGRLAGSATNGINGKVHTRGGNLNESLIILDNRELRNPYHFKDFFSLFSTINETFVDSIDYYSGVFPAKYGGRLSSVMDIQSNQWTDLPTHEANLGLLTSSYTFRHHDAINDNYYMMALRTGGQLINEHLIADLSLKPEFDDGYLKANQTINDQWRMSQHFLVSRDELTIDQDEEVARANYRDQNLWFQWDYDNLESNQLDIQIYASDRYDRRDGSLNDANSVASVNEVVKSKFQGIMFNHQWSLTENLSLNYGFDLSAEETKIESFRDIRHDSELVNLLGFNLDLQRDFKFETHGVSSKSYFNFRYKLSEQWIFDLGAHYLNQQWISGGDLSPRLNIGYFPSTLTSWHFGIGRHQQVQHIDELLLEELEPGYYQPASADLAVLEFNHRFDNNWLILTELYYKKYSRTHPYYENLFNNIHVLPDLFYDRLRINPQDAKAAGIEITLKGKYRNIDWSSSYTYSDVKDQFDSSEQPRSWNQKNAFKFYLGLPIKSWNLGIHGDFHNGWPTTRVSQNNNQLVVGVRNKNSYRDYYQVSMKLDRSWKSALGLWHFELQLTNVLNTENPCCREYDLMNGILEEELKNGLPLIPNLRLGLSW